MMELAGVLLCYCFSLAVNTVYYNYLDFRYHWSALDISLFSSSNGVLLTLTSGVIIRFLLPKRLSMGRGLMIGMLLQVRRLFRWMVCLFCFTQAIWNTWAYSYITAVSEPEKDKVLGGVTNVDETGHRVKKHFED